MKPTPKSDQDTPASGCGCQDSSQVGQEEGGNTLSKRRRLLRASLSAGPVLLALRGKSAMATTTGGVCRFPSTWASVDPKAGGNKAGLSHHPGSDPNCSFGRSPGFWRQAQKRCWWPRGAGPKPDSLPCSFGGSPTGASPEMCAAYLGDGTKVNSVFSGASATNKTMQQLLCSESGTDAWHYCAALLNAWTVVNYPLTPAQVIQMWNGTFAVGGVTWTRARGRTFIEMTYDALNDSTDPVFKVSCVPVPCKV